MLELEGAWPGKFQQRELVDIYACCIGRRFGPRKCIDYAFFSYARLS
jgi:hypothetical protein